MNMLKRKKSKIWVSVICVVLCTVIWEACAANPEKVNQMGDPNTDGPTSTFATSQSDSSTLYSTRVNGPLSVSLQDFNFTLPEDMSIQSAEVMHTGNAYDNGYGFYVGETTVGGVALRYSEQPNSPDAFSETWQTALGVPEASDTTMGYMGGSSNYADYETTYFPDILVNRDDNGNIIQDEIGTYVLENEVTHYFFTNGKHVYDVWFYINRFPNDMQEKLLKSCYIDGITDMAAMESVQDKETEVLAKCSAVMDAVQNGSCHIVIDQFSNSDSESHWSTANYYQDNGNWLIIKDIAPEKENIVDGEQYSVRMANMVVNGARYSNEGKWGKAYTNIEWKEDQMFNDSLKPWLASFRWNDTVAYMDTLIDENRECVMFRVDKKYFESDEAPHYFVIFNFDANDNFVNVDIQINPLLDKEYTITESIVSLDPEMANAEIQKEYQKVIG